MTDTPSAGDVFVPNPIASGALVDGLTLLRGAIYGLLAGNEHGTSPHQMGYAWLEATEGGLTLSATLGQGAGAASWRLSLPWEGDARLTGTFRVDLVAVREALVAGRETEQVAPLRAPGAVECVVEGDDLWLVRDGRRLRIGGTATPARLQEEGRQAGRVALHDHLVAPLVAQAATAAPQVGVFVQQREDGTAVVGTVGLGGLRLDELSLGTPGSVPQAAAVGPTGLSLLELGLQTADESWRRLQREAQVAGERVAKALLVDLWLASDRPAVLGQLQSSLVQEFLKDHPRLEAATGLDGEVALTKALGGVIGFTPLLRRLPAAPSGVTEVLHEAVRGVDPGLTPDEVEVAVRWIAARQAGTARDTLLGEALLAAHAGRLLEQSGPVGREMLALSPRLWQAAERALSDLPPTDPSWASISASGATPHARPTVRSMLLATGWVPAAPAPRVTLGEDGALVGDVPLPGGARFQIHGGAPVRASEHPLAMHVAGAIADRGDVAWRGRVAARDVRKAFERAQSHRLFASEPGRDPLSGVPLGPCVLVHGWHPDRGAALSTDHPLLPADALTLGGREDRDDVVYPLPPRGVVPASHAGVLEATTLQATQGVVQRHLLRQGAPGAPLGVAVVVDAVLGQEFVAGLGEDSWVTMEVVPAGVRLQDDGGRTIVLPGVPGRLLPEAMRPAAQRVGVPDRLGADPWTAAIQQLRTVLRRGGSVASPDVAMTSPEARAHALTARAQHVREGVAGRLARWTALPTRMPSPRRAVELALRFAGGAPATMPLPREERQLNSIFRGVRRAAERLLETLEAPATLFGDEPAAPDPAQWRDFVLTVQEARGHLEGWLATPEPTSSQDPTPPSQVSRVRMRR